MKNRGPYGRETSLRKACSRSSTSARTHLRLRTLASLAGRTNGSALTWFVV